MEPDWGPPPLPRASPPAGPPPAPIGCEAHRGPRAPRPAAPNRRCGLSLRRLAPPPAGPPPRGRDPGRGAGRSRPTPLGSLFEADSKSAVCAPIRRGASRGRRIAVPQCPGRRALAGRGSPSAPSPVASEGARGVCAEMARVRERLGETCHELVLAQAPAGAEERHRPPRGRECAGARGQFAQAQLLPRALRASRWCGPSVFV